MSFPTITLFMKFCFVDWLPSYFSMLLGMPLQVVPYIVFLFSFLLHLLVVSCRFFSNFLKNNQNTFIVMNMYIHTQSCYMCIRWEVHDRKMFIVVPCACQATWFTSIFPRFCCVLRVPSHQLERFKGKHRPFLRATLPLTVPIHFPIHCRRMIKCPVGCCWLTCFDAVLVVLPHFLFYSCRRCLFGLDEEIVFYSDNWLVFMLISCMHELIQNRFG